MFPELNPPYIFAHRGASAYAPENTLSAFELALKQGAHAIELDAKLTRDNRVIVHHDRTVDRTTNGSGAINALTYDDLKSLDAGSWFSKDFCNEKIPLLSEVFESLGNKIFINIELTNYASPKDGLVNEVVKLVKEYQIQEMVMFSSFLPANLINASQLLPAVPCGYLVDGGVRGRQRWPRNMMDLAAEHPWMEDVTLEAVVKAHQKGRRVHVWTVNDSAEMQRLRSIGVDGIFTDDPLIGLNVFCK